METMKTISGLLRVIIIPLLVTSLLGCPARNPEPVDSNANEDLSESAEEPTAESEDEVFIPPVTRMISNPEETAKTIAMNFAERLGYDTAKLYVIEQNEVYKDDAFWLWMLALEGENGPVATVYVRLDLGRIESFDCIHDFAPLAVLPGEDLPRLTVEALDMDDRGYLPAPWVSSTGNTVYRRRVMIGGYDVTVSNVLIRYVPDDGKLIGITWNELEPLDEFEMYIDADEAVEAAAQYVEVESIVPDNLDLIELQDGPSRFTDLNVYWEVYWNNMFIYVRCRDRFILVNDAGPNIPLGF
jgi:hypothetical protein